MIRWMRTLGLWLGRKSQDQKPVLDQSRLVGMYLVRNNRVERDGSPVMGKHERGDGGFAQGRGR